MRAGAQIIRWATSARMTTSGIRVMSLSAVTGQRHMVNDQCQRTTINGQQSEVNGQRSTVDVQRFTINVLRSTVNGQRSTIHCLVLHTMRTNRPQAHHLVATGDAGLLDLAPSRAASLSFHCGREASFCSNASRSSLSACRRSVSLESRSRKEKPPSPVNCRTFLWNRWMLGRCDTVKKQISVQCELADSRSHNRPHAPTHHSSA